MPRYQFRLLADPMTEPAPDSLDVFHARQALLAIGWSAAMMGDLPLSGEECHRAAVDIAHDLPRHPLPAR